MRAKKIVASLACLLATAACLGSCGGGEGQSAGKSKGAGKLVGRWRSTLLADQVVEFKPDGTVVGPPDLRRPAPTGRYEFDGESELKLHLLDEGGFRESFAWQVIFSEDGQKIRFRTDRGLLVNQT